MRKTRCQRQNKAERLWQELDRLSKVLRSQGDYAIAFIMSLNLALA